VGGLFAICGLALIKPIFNLNIQDLGSLLSHPVDPTSIKALKFFQFFNTVGIFIIPGILFAALFIKHPLTELRLLRGISLGNFILIILLMYSLLPAINWLVSWNEQIQLPPNFEGIEQWIKAKEEGARELTYAFLRMEQPNDFWVNILLIALLPAVGEELIFRGIVQPTLNSGRKSPHFGIWISAILFSALHMQFYGFFPRMFLGAFFGYLFVWGRSIWMPILAHFINNATAVLIAYKLGIDGMEEEFDTLGAAEGTWAYSVIGLTFFGTLLILFYRNNRQSSN
jgi:hypothetical protein